MHIYKKFSKDKGKGILIATHKEFSFCIDVLNKVKEKYNIICHTGFDTSPPRSEIISLQLISDSRCSNERFLPYTSRNFLRKDYLLKDKESSIKKVHEISNTYGHSILFPEGFDFIYVGRCVEFKKTIDVYEYFYFMATQHFKTACMIILDAKTSNDGYYKRFCDNIKDTKNILIFDTHKIDHKKNTTYFGLNSEELSSFYNSSKFYVHGCEQEGESRTIHEALCCGCVVLAKDNMKGGGLDHLNSENSKLYNSRNWKTVFQECCTTSKYDRKDISEKNVVKFNELYTTEKFRKILYDKLNYKEDFDIYQSNIDDTGMMFKLPAHDKNVPWYKDGNPTADIKTQEQKEIFKKLL